MATDDDTTMNLVRRQLEEQESSPVLFVGSGLSRRLIQMETWDSLLSKMCERARLNYLQIRSISNGDLPLVARRIAEQLNEPWWNADEFTDSRMNAGSAARTADFPLRFEICRHIRDRDPAACIAGLPSDLAEEVSWLRESKVDALITTNWDCLLELLFPEFRVYVGQRDLVETTPMGVGEIYKIHGCSTRPDSLVLTDVDFRDFPTKNPYLASKLLGLLLEHPIIFMGYSLNDPNVQSILQTVICCLSGDQISRLGRRLMIIEWNPSSESEPVVSYSHWVIPVPAPTPIPVTIVRTHSFVWIFRLLAELRKPFPARLLRTIKSRIYELVLSTTPSDHLLVDIESASMDEHDVVVGIGKAPSFSGFGHLGYRSVTVDDVVSEFLSGDYQIDPDEFLGTSLPPLLHNKSYVPIYYLLNRASEEVRSSTQSLLVKHKCQPSRLLPGKDFRGNAERFHTEGKSFSELVIDLGVDKALNYAPFFTFAENAIDVLAVLRENVGRIKTGSRTAFRKALCIVDYILHSPDVSWPAAPTKRRPPIKVRRP